MTFNDTKLASELAKGETAEVLLGQLQEGMENLVENSLDYLRAMARFWKYSLGNQMLIMLGSARQGFTATNVAGFNVWKDLGRTVIKGSKGIAILAPCFPKKPDPEEDEDSRSSSPIYFRVVHVFDVSQTEGEPLPEGPGWPLITGDDTEILCQAITAQVEAMGINIVTGPEHRHGEARGWYSPSEKRLWVDAALPANQRTKTLAHEFGHAAMGHGGERGELHRGDKETEAEAFAYILTYHFGFDVGEGTFPYLLGWAIDDKNPKESLKNLKTKLNSVRIKVGQIIDTMEEWNGWGSHREQPTITPDTAPGTPEDPPFVPGPEPTQEPQPLQPALFQTFPNSADFVGVMASLPIPLDVANSLALKDGYPPEQMHITLVYFGESKDVLPETIDKVKEVLGELAASQMLPLEAIVSGTGRFDGETDDPFYAQVNSPSIQAFRQHLVTRLEEHSLPYSNTFPDYKPHITLACLKKDDPSPDKVATDVNLTFNSVRLSVGNSGVVFFLGTQSDIYEDVERLIRDAFATGEITLEV